MSGITATRSAEMFKAYKAGALKIDKGVAEFTDKAPAFQWGKLKGPKTSTLPHLSPSDLQQFVPLINVQKKVEKAWQDAGGAASLVGIPADGDISVERDGDGWLSHFRGGTIRSNSAGADIEVVERYVITLAYKALECVTRAEKGNDEIYGSVAILANPPGSVANFAMPTMTFNKSDQRIAEFSHSVEFLRGTSVAFSALLMEHDSGDREKIRRKIQTFYNNVETKVRTLTDPLIGEELSSFAVGTLGDVLNVATIGIFDLLGMGDDAFNPASKLVSWEEFYNDPPKQTYSHQPDPRSGTYAFKLDVTGVSNGRYACFFDFATRHETEVRPLN